LVANGLDGLCGGGQSTGLEGGQDIRILKEVTTHVGACGFVDEGRICCEGSRVGRNIQVVVVVAVFDAVRRESSTGSANTASIVAVASTAQSSAVTGRRKAASSVFIVCLATVRNTIATADKDWGCAGSGSAARISVAVAASRDIRNNLSKEVGNQGWVVGFSNIKAARKQTSSEELTLKRVLECPSVVVLAFQVGQSGSGVEIAVVSVLNLNTRVWVAVLEVRVAGLVDVNDWGTIAGQSKSFGTSNEHVEEWLFGSKLAEDVVNFRLEGARPGAVIDINNA
jgi:hypothetical protein